MAAAEGGWGPAKTPGRRKLRVLRHAPAGSSLSLPCALLYRIFITTTRGKDASDKYHKSRFSVLSFQFSGRNGVDDGDFCPAKCGKSVAQGLQAVMGRSRPCPCRGGNTGICKRLRIFQVQLFENNFYQAIGNLPVPGNRGTMLILGIEKNVVAGTVPDDAASMPIQESHQVNPFQPVIPLPGNPGAGPGNRWLA
jgi:hypothetical protein